MSGTGSGDHHIFTIGGIVIVLLIVLYILLGVALERCHCNFGHEASLVIIVGASISYLAYAIGFSQFNEAVSFDHNIFFYFCLPPIVFASGFNMKRKVFFENFTSVLIFGVLSTILQFVLFSVGLYFINSLGLFTKYNFLTG
jgi:NhaP-type Na+/H+ or K+/H+ antiporter